MESKQQEPEKKGTSFVRRDRLVDMQKQVQQFWLENNTYQSNIDATNPKKFFVTFPYPYVNGRLHMGHGFSFSKADFTARYKRLMGYNVLFPQAFHCTGMPISAAADRLKHELQKYGNPPVFPPAVEGQTVAYQYDILAKVGVPIELIPKFADPYFWVEYFPPFAQEDLTKWGAPVDWRRSFITTDKNPYYDSFIRWQFTLLKERDYIKFGKRPSIFCMKDNQMCADHDRSEGEGIGPQEYTLIKLRVLGWRKEELQKQFEGKNVFLVAATLRTETMFGQTNCFVLPTGVYGAYVMKNDEIFICSERSAYNMAYQYLTKTDKQIEKIIDISGEDLIGLPLKAPLSVYPQVYSLPMMSIKMDKGTGVVTSVPSDAPDDYAALRDLQNKEAFRKKYNITPEMVDFKPVPIIDIPGYGDLSAIAMCEKYGIQSQNEKDKLAKAKEETYTKGFYEGVMKGDAVGKYNGLKVTEAKPLVREELIKANEGCVYYEPEGKVVSRSQEECVVSLCDQWYIKYGAQEWRDRVYEHAVKGFRMFSDISYNQIKFTIDWLKEWGCSRSYGLGTKLPFDEQYLIESLSDSTIYMSYYTISHFLQGDVPGSKPGSLGIKPEQLTRQVWDYIYQGISYDAATMPVEEEKLQTIRKEFLYWYPLDLRVSAKDLVRNHLTMALYNHAAIWEKEPNLWPKAYFTNGYSQINGAKMSKQTGNFFTIAEIVEQYGADAARFACAEAGDGLEDANFTQKNAEDAVLKLATIEMWLKLVKNKQFRTTDQGDSQLQFYDQAFDNQILSYFKEALKGYEGMKFREVTKYGFHEFTSIKEYYLLNCGAENGPGPRRDLILKWIQYQLLILFPITPHFSEYVYKNYYLEMVEDKSKYPSSIADLRFPDIADVTLDYSVIRAITSLNTFLHNLRKNKQSSTVAKDGKKIEIEKLIVIYAKEYLDWQKRIMEIIKGALVINENNDKVIADEWKKTVKEDPLTGGKNMAASMSFGSFLTTQYAELGEQVFDHQIKVDEGKLLRDHQEKITKEMGVTNIEYYDLSEIGNLPPAVQKQIKGVVPFQPKDIWIQVTPAKK